MNEFLGILQVMNYKSRSKDSVLTSEFLTFMTKHCVRKHTDNLNAHMDNLETISSLPDFGNDKYNEVAQTAKSMIEIINPMISKSNIEETIMRK